MPKNVNKLTPKRILIALVGLGGLGVAGISAMKSTTGDPLIFGLPFISSRGPANSILYPRIKKIHAPSGCNVFSSRYYSHGEDAPGEYYNLQFSCQNGTAGQQEDSVVNQLVSLGYHSVADTAPNPDQVLRASFEDGQVRLDLSVGSPALASRNPGKLVSESDKRQEPGNGMNIIMTALK